MLQRVSQLDCYTYFDFPFQESDTFDNMCLDSHLRRSTSLGSSADFLCTMRHHRYNLKTNNALLG